MAKIGTAHVEIKPVLNEEALEALVKRIEDAIAAAVARALNTADHRGRLSDIRFSAPSFDTRVSSGSNLCGQYDGHATTCVYSLNHSGEHSWF